MIRKFSKSQLRHLNPHTCLFGKLQLLIALLIFGTVHGLTQFNNHKPSTGTNVMNASSSSSDTLLKETPCWLAIITEPDACDTDERAEESYSAIAKAVSERPDSVSLVSIRLKPSDSPQVLDRATKLTKRLVQLSENYRETGTGKSSKEDQEKSPSPTFKVVCSSDWVEAAVLGGAHGVHVKEHHLSQIPTIRERLLSRDHSTCPVWIGTSAHSVESALNSYRQYQPDYYFVGTCFLTASHPEKTSEADLEGPTLPGKVQRALANAAAASSTPKVMAIGGIDATNCHIPVELGADGVAVIRSVLQAKDPAKAVADMQSSMNKAVAAAIKSKHEDAEI